MRIAALLLVLWTAVAEARLVSGTLQFTDDARGTLSTRPIRSVTVTILRGATPLGSGVTSSTGRFAIAIPDSVPAGTELAAVFHAKNHAGNVYLDMDWVNDRIRWRRAFAVPAGSDPIDASALVRVESFSVHFSILEALTRGRQWVDARAVQGDDVEQVYLEYPDCEGSHYSPFWGDITLRGEPARGYGCAGEDDGWQDFTVLHEYGHHVMREISDMDARWLSDPSHSACTDNGYWFAWIEGWATYFSRTVTDTYPELVRGLSIEGTVSCPTSATEGKTRAILWDLYDRAGESHDRVDGTTWIDGRQLRDVLFEVFDVEQDDAHVVGNVTVDPTTSILSFHDHLVAREVYPGSHADIDRIYQGNGVPVHAWASYTFVALTGPPEVQPGAVLPIAMRISNPGTGYTDEPLRIRILSSPAGIDTELTVAAFSGVATLNAGVVVPPTMPDGPLFVIAQLDPTDRFPEVSESDNSLAFAVEVAWCPTCDVLE